jgi:hypothetical protein
VTIVEVDLRTDAEVGAVLDALCATAARDTMRGTDLRIVLVKTRSSPFFRVDCARKKGTIRFDLPQLGEGCPR